MYASFPAERDVAGRPQAAPEALPGTVMQILVVALAIFIVMVDGFDLQAIGFVAPEMAREWGLQLVAFGPVFSAALAGSMVGALSAGLLTRHIGLRGTLILSLMLFGICTFVTAWVDTLNILVIVRLLAGLGLGAAVPVVMSIVAANSSERYRATLVILTLCGQPIGAILGSVLCARMMPTYGWQFAFYLGGVLPLLLIAPIAWVPLRNAGPGLDRHAGRLRQLFSDELLKTTVLVWASVFLSSFIIYTVVNWMPGTLRAEGYSLQTSVHAISLFNCGGIAGALVLGPLMDRYGALRAVPPAFALAILGLAALDLTKSTSWLFMTAAFVTGVATYGGGISLGSLALMSYPSPLRTLGTGWAMGCGRLGAALGPLGAGFMLSATGMPISRLFHVAAVAAALVVICLLLLKRVRDKGLTDVC